MKSHFEYAGYLGSAEVDAENGVLFGRLLFIRDAIGYSASTVEGLEQAFREAVDDYLELCKEDGSEPDVPCKGSFNVRVGPERHREAAIAARRMDLGLNEFVCFAVDNAIQARTVVHKYEFKYVGVAPAGDPTFMTASTGANVTQEPSGVPARH